MEKKREEWPKVDQEKLDKVVKEYIKRMIKIHKTGHGITTDYQIDCPQCDRARAMDFTNRDWHCLWVDCRYILPRESYPFGPNGIKEVFHLKNLLDFLNKWKHLLELE